MSRWTPDEHGCIYDEAGCFARLTPNKAERLATRHNADIDALTAERDEWKRRLDADDGHQRALDEMHTRYNVETERDELQRRLDAVVAMLKPPVAPTQPCRFVDWCAISDRIKVLTPLHARALAIAEGREG